MAISAKVKQFLEENGVEFEQMEHTPAFTASEIAGTQHVPGKQMIKSVIVKTDGEFIMCVLPAIHMIDFEKLAKVTGAKDIQLAEESDLAHLFPDYETGAEPPFGQLYGLKVFADQMIKEDNHIVFNAGTHTDVVKINLDDFSRLVNPTFADIGTHI